MRPFASWFVSVYFGAVALYSLVLAFVYDALCLPLYLQAGLAIASAIGIFMMKRWSLWLAAVSLLPIIVIELSALNFSIGVVGFSPDGKTLIVNVSYVLIVILAVLSILLLADKRREFK